MGNIRPKLSRAMIREMEIRAQLGVSPNSWKAKGPKKAQRARKELERRERVQRQRYPRWDDLCYELQDMILSHLSIADLANVREAGLGGVSVDSCERLRKILRRRIEAVKPLWRIWRRGTPKYRSEGDRKHCTPVEFTSKVSRLCVSPDSDGLPESICEMKALRILDISRTPHSAFLGMPPPLTRLPKALAKCQGLLELRMSHHGFEQIPECVLQLKTLRRLEMEFNSKLKGLPEDIGERLRQLRLISIRGCRKVKKLPESLLKRLETNIANLRKHRPPLLVSGRFFEDNYLTDTITAERYPKLAEYLKSGQLTGPDVDWGGDPEFGAGLVVDLPFGN